MRSEAIFPSDIPPSPAYGSEDIARLRYACREVEGLFLGLLMKEGLKSIIEGQENDDERPAQVGQLMEYTIEQTARMIAHQGGMGLADSLLEQLTKI